MPPPSVACDIHDLASLVGREVTSDWLDVTQDMVSGFARITRDEQWIHVDADRAREHSPYGATIAHGFSHCRSSVT